MFTGISAFPLTPLRDDVVDEAAFASIITRLAATGVDSITALGSTGSYAYLSTPERARVAALAVEHAGATPVIVGVGALRTSDVLAHVRAAEVAGAQGVLLAPVSYQPLTSDDVFGLFEEVTRATRLPVIVYDNPMTTHFTFTPELYARIAGLPGIASIKIGVTADLGAARAYVAQLRALLPAHVTIGVAGDGSATVGLLAGCDIWYSVLGGTLPNTALELMQAVRRAGEHAIDAPVLKTVSETASVPAPIADALAASARLDPLWALFAEFGSNRVIAAVAERLGFAPRQSLPLPIRGLDDATRARVAEVIAQLELTG